MCFKPPLLLTLLQMVFSEYVKLRILYHANMGYKGYTISRLLEEEGIKVSTFGVYKFLKVYKETGTTARRSGSGRPTKVTARVKELVDEQMTRDDETTATQLHRMLLDNEVDISLSTILRCRTSLGWTFRGSAYCQLIRENNKVKRLEWAQRNKDDNFDDVIWTDECSIQLENHRRFCCRKEGQPPKPKPRLVHVCITCGCDLFKGCIQYVLYNCQFYLYRAKHPVKVHVWAGISKKGRSGICILMASWTVTCFATSLIRHFSHSWKNRFPPATGSCRTTILSTPLSI